MTATLEGKVAIVTGSGRGLGLATAQALAANGATVVLSDLDLAAVEDAARDVPNAIAIACDVRDEQQVQALVEATVQRHGGLHLMVANAGVARVGPLLTTDLAAWREVTSVNLDGVFLSIRYAAPAIIRSGGGAIVTIASTAATTGTPLTASYAAAKAGVLNLTKTAAVEFRDQGVRVNAVLPAFVRTEMGTSAMAAYDELLAQPPGTLETVALKRQGRWGDAAEVAAAVVYLASDQTSSWVTGAGLVVDGGLTASLM